MDILHFCPSQSFSGMEQYAFQMAADQKRRGRKVGFVVHPGTELQKRCEEENLETYAFDFSRFGELFRFWRFLKGKLNQKDLRVLHLHSTQEVSRLSGILFLQKIAGAHRPRVILQTHIWINHRKQDLFHRLIYSVVDEVWCSSGPAQETLTRNLPVNPSKIKIVNYGRDVENLRRHFLDRDQARRQLGLPENAVVIGCVSRIEPSKGIRELLEAAIPILKSYDSLHVAVIGGKSPQDPLASEYFDGLTAWIGNLSSDLRTRIHMLGTIPDSYKFLKSFDVYVLPSHEECFSLSLLDAQLAGLPVVGSRSGGTPEIVRDGQTGWLFTPRDVEDLRQKMELALQSRHLWPQLGETASRRVEKDFHQRRIFDSILENYEKRA